MQLGLKEADTLKFTSFLIYYQSEWGVYTQNGWHDAVVIKSNKGAIKMDRAKLIYKV